MKLCLLKSKFDFYPKVMSVRSIFTCLLLSIKASPFLLPQHLFSLLPPPNTCTYRRTQVIVLWIVALWFLLIVTIRPSACSSLLNLLASMLWLLSSVWAGIYVNTKGFGFRICWGYLTWDAAYQGCPDTYHQGHDICLRLRICL